MTENLLRHETSPYLLQHARQPVHWRGWNAAALAEARQLDRPILLSIGYAACHWCHVMAHESFDDHEVAARMNASFVSIKVDREERPDIDQIYMAALHALGEQGGWPLTMFLMPDGRPIWGGTYFPKNGRYGRPGFVDVLDTFAGLYRDDNDRLAAQAGAVIEHLARRRTPASGAPALDAALLDQAADTLVPMLDLVRGGTDGAPKFPNVTLIDLLARTAERTARTDAASFVEATLSTMARGGIFDHVGGGYSRYSVDADWLVPHFEKMLSDNGLLLEQLALTLPRSPNAPLYRDRIGMTIAWLLREMKLEGGGFAASLDADSDRREGAFYVWTPEDLADALGAEEADWIGALYDIRDGGNWDGVSVPNRLRTPGPLGTQDEMRRQGLLERLRLNREKRPRPTRDDKLLVDWNAFLVAGIATAGFLLDQDEWIEEARALFRFLIAQASVDARPSHALRLGRRIHPGFSSDLAALAHAALALHQATRAQPYIEEAIRLLDLLEKHHATGGDGFHFTADDAEELVLRQSERIDDAAPNAHGLAVQAYVRIWALTGESRFRDRADALLAAASADIARNVFGTASLLAGLEFRLGVRTILILAEGEAGSLLDVVRNNWSRRLVLDIRRPDEQLPLSHPAHGHGQIDGLPTAYVCEEGRCSLPVTTAEGLAQLLETLPTSS